MPKAFSIKELSVSTAALAGAWLTQSMGGWDKALNTLIIFMAVDFITGLMVAALWGKSSKSENGSLESRAAGKGLVRKGAFMMVVLVANQLDETLGLGGFARTATIYGFMGVEGLSIVENMGIMGVPMPAVVRQAFEQLKSKSETLPNQVEKDVQG